MVVAHEPIEMTVEQVTDPLELAKMRRRKEQFDRNFACMKASTDSIFRNHRGKVVCFAGGQCFVGDTTDEAVAMGSAAHPDDKGIFTRYIPREKLVRIYAI